MPLVLIFQRLLEAGQVPKQWKEAHVIAIDKRKQQRCDPGQAIELKIGGREVVLNNNQRLRGRC